jgi:hypothetical protein
MNLHLRTVIYARRVVIAKVPVYECGGCGSSEVFSGVKQDIGRLIKELGADPAPRTIQFDQMNEWAGVLTAALSGGRDMLQASDVARAAEERTNELLDLWLIASSLGDEAWKAELRERLSQLSAQYIT